MIPEAETEVEKSHPYGKPMNLMKFDDEENIIIDAETLDNTFLHPEVKDRKIVAVSIVGAFRKGKSFLMDYALRYMYAHVSDQLYVNFHSILCNCLNLIFKNLSTNQ